MRAGLRAGLLRPDDATAALLAIDLLRRRTAVPHPGRRREDARGEPGA